MEETRYRLIINNGVDEGFIEYTLGKEEFIERCAHLLVPPKKVFLGLGDFLELGDYSRLLDSVFFDTDGSTLAAILDKNNRRISKDGNIPFSFFKLAVYYPDFLLKEVPLFCISTIGKKSRLFPGAVNFIKHIRRFDPVILSAIPYEISMEFVHRVGLSSDNLVSTEYQIGEDKYKRNIYAGGIKRFLSGNRRSIIIEKRMNELNLSSEDVLYIGHGEAGAQAFSSINSMAFNPTENIIPQSRVSVYGSSLESILVFFNSDGALNHSLLTDSFEQNLPSLVVFSETKGKSQELIDIELEHRRFQNNVIGQRIEYSGENYRSIEREIEMIFTGSSYNIKEVRARVKERMELYKESPGDLVKDIYEIAMERYKNFCSV